ncbi:Co2+/Mg2+ efflux protein ApaG [Pararhodospirillum photometricum]|nr:Co2+/Mg2+ efflux protein ApaG [Pararhodospirillum photometricum]
MYEQTTEGILVRVQPVFVPAQSEPDAGRFVWAYHVTIVNKGAETVRLIRRHWRIIDALGRIQEIDGDGVVGEQPVLEPGSLFGYTSGAPLPTPSGVMSGSYLMTTEEGRAFHVAIPPFSLDSPHQEKNLN